MLPRTMLRVVMPRGVMPRGVMPRGVMPRGVTPRVPPRKPKRASPRKSRHDPHPQTALDELTHLQTWRISGHAVPVATKISMHSMRRRRCVPIATTPSVRIANPSVAADGLMFEPIFIPSE